MTIDDPADLVPLVAIAVALLGGIVWLIRAQNAISREFRPNGGSSMKDAVNRIEKDIRDVRYRVDQHIDNHNR